MKYLIPIFKAFSAIYILAALLCFYLYFIDGRNILYYKNLPFPTDKQVYHQGDIIGVKRQGCASRDIHFTVRASIVDGFVLNFSAFDGTRMKGCVEKEGLELTVPKFLPPGMYHLSGITTVYVNPLQSRDVSWRTQSFQVIK